MLKRKILFKVLIILISITVVFNCNVIIYSNGAIFKEITGIVYDDDNTNKKIEGVKVELLNASGTPIKTEWTDKNGVYKFSGVINGDYQIKMTYGSEENYAKAPVATLKYNGHDYEAVQPGKIGEIEEDEEVKLDLKGEVMLVLDTTGSMSYAEAGEDRMEHLKKGAINFLDEVFGANLDVKVGLVSFAVRGDVQVEWADELMGFLGGYFDLDEFQRFRLLQYFRAYNNIYSVEELDKRVPAFIEMADLVLNGDLIDYLEARLHNTVTNNKNELVNNINSLEAMGNTCIWSGIELAIQEFTNNSNVPKTIIVFTDGEHNCDTSTYSSPGTTAHSFTSQYLKDIVDSGINIIPVILGGHGRAVFEGAGIETYIIEDDEAYKLEDIFYKVMIGKMSSTNLTNYDFYAKEDETRRDVVMGYSKTVDNQIGRVLGAKDRTPDEIKKFLDNTNMFAITEKFTIDDNTTTIVINCALGERKKNELAIKVEIADVKYKLTNNNYLINLALNPGRKQLSIEVDQDLRQGSTLFVEYKITVTNNGKFPARADKIVSYLDYSNMLLDFEPNFPLLTEPGKFNSSYGWTKVDKQLLKIDENIKSGLTNMGRYLVTSYLDGSPMLDPGQTSEPIRLVARVITSRNGAYDELENTAEILQYSSLSGRRTLARPGNYNPKTPKIKEIDTSEAALTILPPLGAHEMWARLGIEHVVIAFTGLVFIGIIYKRKNS